MKLNLLKKPSSFISAALKGMSLMLPAIISLSASGQNPLLHIQGAGGDGIRNHSIEYLPLSKEYLLGNEADPLFINGMNNKGPFLPLGRIHLQIIPDNLSSPPTSNMSKVYCTQIEVLDYPQCRALSTYFQPTDARRAKNGDYIVCGFVYRTFESTNCPGPTYEDAFVLRTNNRGAVVWYKRYEPQTGKIRLNSLIETNNGNIIVAGSYGSKAFAMGVNSMGVVMWNHLIEATSVVQQTPVPAQFSKIASYAPNPGQQYYVLTGPAYQYAQYVNYHANYGGGLLVVVDANGMLLTNKLLTREGTYPPHIVKTIGVADALDGGNIVLTGSTGGTYCGQNDDLDLMLIKLNPLMPGPPQFSRIYQHGSAASCNGTTCTIGFANEGAAVTVGQSGGNIFVGGYENAISSTYGGAVYLETDNMGNRLRYVQHSIPNASIVSGITYNSTNNYPAYSGLVVGSNITSFLTKNNYGHDGCDPDLEPAEIDFDFDYIDNTDDNMFVNVVTEDLVAFDLPDDISVACGKSNKNAPTGVQSIARGKDLMITPNPAMDYADIQLSLSMAGGTANVYDLQGRLVKNQSFTNADQSVRINTSGFAPGMYSVHVQSGNKTAHLTFVKQ